MKRVEIDETFVCGNERDVQGGIGKMANAIEGTWRHLEYSIAGTHVSFSAKCLSTYAKEFEYRFNRWNDAASTLPELLSTFEPSKPQRG